MNDRILVSNLILSGRHGALPQEHALDRRFEIDLAIETDLRAAARSDSVADTISYAEAVTVAEAAFAERANLIETVAGRIAAALLDHFAAALAVEVTIRKPGAPIAAVFDSVAVTIRRVRAGPASR
jgi:dihydroneopterin aldolase